MADLPGIKPDQLLSRLQTLGGSFTATQLATLGAVLVMVSGLIVFSTRWIEKPSYAVLYSRMEPDAASQVVAKLKQLKVGYELDDGGGTVRVPASRVDELRLELGGQGLPTSGRIGFEIFDKTAFGATEFMEKVNYRRALEGEIARTIATIAEVSSARVHIAMGKDSTFGESRPTKASVVLKLRGQAGLPAATIAGVAGLVAGSVEGLRPEAVVILDSFGRPLSRSLGEDGMAGAAGQMERQQRLEADLMARVVSMLEPVVGPDRVRVNVALKLNPQSREETQETWDPNAVVRTRQLTSDSLAGGATATGGIVAGARGNIPPPATPQPLPGQAPAPPSGTPALVAGPGRMAETTSYEVSRTMRHITQPPGEVARMSVAVILDDAVVVKKAQDGAVTSTRVPRSREELQKVQTLVSAAVGLDPARGDQLTVEHMSFDEPLAEEVEAPSIVDRIAPQVTEWSRLGVIAAIAIFAILVVVRPLMRRAAPLAAAPVAELVPVPAAPDPAPAGPALPPGTALATAGPPVRSIEDMEQEIEHQLDAETSDLGVDAFRVPVLTRRIAQMANREPENVARLMRTWMRERGERA
ncbi:MAG: flagellar basal-body MS-ring/collar protein FliF [Vicinamibacterales bacterium]